MKSRIRQLQSIPACLLCVMFVSAAWAQAVKSSVHDRTQFGSDINVGPDEEIGDATCFGCSVRIRGHVTGGVTVFGGTVIIEDQGEVSGDVTNFGRGVRLDRNTKVGGDVTVFGGPIRRDAQASVAGDVTSFKGAWWLLLVFGLPLGIFAAIIILVIWVVRRLTRPSVPVVA